MPQLTDKHSLQLKAVLMHIVFASLLFCNCSCIHNSVLPTLHSIVPGPVSELSYEENTNTSVIITWKPPKEPNGDLVAYFVEHGVYQNESTRSVAIDVRGPMHTVVRALGKLMR